MFSFVVDIAGQDFELRRDINESEDYVLVHETVWELLESWYRGGPELKRSVIVLGIQVRTRRCAFCSYLLQAHRLTCARFLAGSPSRLVSCRSSFPPFGNGRTPGREFFGHVAVQQ